MPIDTPQQIALKADCMVALDGERELRGHKGDMLTFTITKKGHGASRQERRWKKRPAAAFLPPKDF